MEMEGRRTDEQPINPDTSSNDWPFSYFKFCKERDSPDQVRNSIMVVAALIVAASYQAVMNPPDIFKDWPRSTKLVFLYANTLAWSSSANIIEMLTGSFPFQRELRLSFLSMGFAYGFVAGELIKPFSNGELIIMLLCYFLPWLIRWVPHCIKNKCCS